MSHLPFLRRAETVKTQSCRAFPGLSAELSSPLCSLQESYLLNVREAGSAVRTMSVRVLTPPLTSPVASGK